LTTERDTGARVTTCSKRRLRAAARIADRSMNSG
jgi:hypothetical protein